MPINKFGYCKFGGYCRKRHVDKLCDVENCDISSCESRHPRRCKVYEQYGRCKFMEFCKYKHENISENEVLEKRIQELREQMMLKDKQIYEIANKIDTITSFLKNRDWKLDELDEEDLVPFHELDDEGEYTGKLNVILANEDNYETKETLIDNEVNGLIFCDFCPEITYSAHIWKKHGAKLTIVFFRCSGVPRRPLVP